MTTPGVVCGSFASIFSLRVRKTACCDHLEGWDREGGREGDARGKRYGDICIYIADSLCYKAETNTTL